MYFIYKQGSGIAPQAGYSILSQYVGGGETWWLASTEKDLTEVQALSLEKLIIGTDTDEAVLAKFPDLKAQRASALRAVGSKQLTVLNDAVGGYFKEERETWYVQKAEATAFLADNTAATPMLSAIVANRDDLASVSDLATLIQENTTALEAASGSILGKQQSALVSLYMAADLTTAMAVEFPA